jgi:Phosphotransferase enzyme family
VSRTRIGPRPPTVEIRGVLERLLQERLGPERSIAALERRTSAYRTSHALDELDVVLDDGKRLDLVFKQLGPEALSEVARRAKPEFLRDPLREIEVYETVLGTEGIWAPACYGSVVDPGRGKLWLFLERVSGVELYQVGELDTWCETAGWLARMHAALREPAARRKPSSLLRYDAGHYRRFAARALEFGQPPGAVEPLLRRYDVVVERLLELPDTFSHGEFYAANVVVERRPDGLRVAPVDWEMAGWAPRLLDLAALTSGSWGADERQAMARAYRSALEPGSGLPGDESRFLEALELCRLQLAVQWLGWSPDWTPPAEHAHDWSAAASRLVAELDL